jgi:hypothetical protein
MNANKFWGSNIYIIAVAIPILIILFPFGYSVVSTIFARDVPTSEVFLEKPDPKHENCVRDVKYMRYHHWELLRQIREEVVRYGKRGDVGLKKCRECHTSRERFCDKCHNSVSMTPACYGCHYYP